MMKTASALARVNVMLGRVWRRNATAMNQRASRGLS